MNETEAINNRIDKIERQLRKQYAAPTHPIYDSTNFPQDAVYGQHVQDQNNNMWIYGQDDQWHQVGAGKGAAARVQASYAIGGGPNPNLVFPASSTTQILFYDYSSTDKTAIAFGDSPSWPPNTNTPIKTVWCNPGNWFSPGSNGGVYTFNCGLHIATGGYSSVDLIINNQNELTPEGWMGTDNLGFFGWWGQVTHVVRSQLSCESGEGKGVYVYVHNNNAFDVYPGWIAMSCTYVPTLDVDTFSNPLALTNGFGGL